MPVMWPQTFLLRDNFSVFLKKKSVWNELYRSHTPGTFKLFAFYCCICWLVGVVVLFFIHWKHSVRFCHSVSVAVHDFFCRKFKSFSMRFMAGVLVYFTLCVQNMCIITYHRRNESFAVIKFVKFMNDMKLHTMTAFALSHIKILSTVVCFFYRNEKAQMLGTENMKTRSGLGARSWQGCACVCVDRPFRHAMTRVFASCLSCKREERSISV